MYDVIIIGGGPAGMTAGLYSTWFGMKVLLFDDTTAPSQLSLATEVKNYPGIETISGSNLLKAFHDQTEKMGAEIKDEKVSAIKIEGDVKKVFTTNGEYETRAIIVCTGAKHRSGGIPGEKEFMGKGVSYCATCDGHFFVDKDVIVWGGGDTALTYALHLQTIGCRTTVVHRRNTFKASDYNVDKAKEAGVKFILEKTLKEIKGDQLVTGVVLDDDTEVPASAVFVSIGEVPSVELLKSAGVKVTDTNFIEVDKAQKTNIEGIYAAGDVTTNYLKQIVVACGEGAVASKSALDYVQSKK